MEKLRKYYMMKLILLTAQNILLSSAPLCYSSEIKMDYWCDYFHYMKILWTHSLCL